MMIYLEKHCLDVASARCFEKALLLGNIWTISENKSVIGDAVNFTLKRVIYKKNCNHIRTKFMIPPDQDCNDNKIEKLACSFVKIS